MPSPKVTAEFITKKVEIRGQRFTIRELPIGDYDDLVKKATVKRPNPVNENGPELELTDNTQLLKFMVLKCVIDPKLTPQTLSEMPMRVVLGLNKTVNDMHFPDNDAASGDIIEIEDEDEDEATPGEG